MAIDYSIKAIPTMYDGRLYRSRLEAKWAAFFDLLEWKYEYEPIDLGKWSPDFQLVAKSGRVVYVEIKPITTFDMDTIAGRIAACRPDTDTSVLLVGSMPFLPVGSTPAGSYMRWMDSGSEIGWGAVIEPNDDLENFRYIHPMYIARGGDEPSLFDIYQFGDNRGWLNGLKQTKDNTPPWGFQASKSLLKQHWNDACNIVQWHKKDA